MRGWFRRRGEVRYVEEIRMGHVYRYHNEETGKTFIFTPLSGWGRHNRQFGASYMRIKCANGKFGDICDLDIGDEVVVTRLA